MKVIVKSGEVRRDEFTPTEGKNAGKTTVHFKQAVALDTGGDFPLPFEIAVNNANDGYAPGEYTLSPECFRASRYNSLEINSFAIRLIPAKSQTSKAA